MDSVIIYVRIRDQEKMEKILLRRTVTDEYSNGDVLWESAGKYYLEAYQCGTHPSICSIEKDHNILNTKEEIALQIIDEINKLMSLETQGSYH